MSNRHVKPSSQIITRPADTTQYAAGDLVANSTTAGSVTPFLFSRNALSGRSGGLIRGGMLKKSTTTVTVASFRMHLFSADPGAVTNGDNGALAIASIANQIGFLDFDFATIGNDINIGGGIGKQATAPINAFTFQLLAGGQLFGLLAAIGAYTPGSAETFLASLDVEV